VKICFQCPECGYLKDSCDEELSKTRWCHNLKYHESSKRRGMEKVQVQVVKEDNQSVIDNALELINRRMDELEDVMDEWDQLTKMSELMDRMSVNDREEMRNV
jgi:hypothetical protein